jgi:tripartite-type tricarboxylate transporter receptor subunit TctC
MGILSKLLHTLALVSVAILAVSGPAQAQTAGAQRYPNRPIKMVVPYAPGGSTDVVARLVGSKLAEAWGQPVVVENRTGAGGMIGNAAVAKSPGDGYTILVTIAGLIQAPAMYSKINYDAFQDLVPISQLSLSADLLIVPASIPASTLKEFVALVKANPKKYSFGSYGNATSAHIHGEMLNMQAGLDLEHIAYKGAAPMMTDLLAGQIASGFADIGTARAHLKSGKFKVLAVTGANRLKMLPDVPTFTELGYKAYEPYGWIGAFVPAGTPNYIVTKLSGEMGRIMRLPDIAGRIEDLGQPIVGSTSEEFSASIKKDAPIWAKVIKDANIKIE